MITGAVILAILYVFFDRNLFGRNDPNEYVVPKVRTGGELLHWSGGIQPIVKKKFLGPSHVMFVLQSGESVRIHHADLDVDVAKDGTIIHTAETELDRRRKEKTLEGRRFLESVDRLRVERDIMKYRAKEDFLISAEAINRKNGPGGNIPGQGGA